MGLFRRHLFFGTLATLLFCNQPVAAGQSTLLDTIEYSLHQKPRFFCNLLTYNSFVSDEFVNFFGFKAGLKYNKRIKFGLGFFYLNPNAVVSSIRVQEDSLVTQTNGELQARFFTLSAEYIYFSKFPWQFSVFPLEFGVGGAHYRYISQLGDHPRLETPDVALIFYQPSITAQYSIFKWFGVGASAGYRFTLYSSKEVKEDFNSIGFSIGIRLFVDEAYKAVFPSGLHLSSGKTVK